MDDRDFFDLLFQQFAKTTGAENTFWMPEQVAPGVDGYHIYAVDAEQNKTPVTDECGLSEVDADWITAVHGCFPDLVRRLHAALDEADQLDMERDEAEQELFKLAMENEELSERIRHLEALQRDDQRTATDAIADRDAAWVELEAAKVKLTDERGYSSYLQCDINDLRAELDAANAENAELRANVDVARSERDFARAEANYRRPLG